MKNEPTQNEDPTTPSAQLKICATPLLETLSIKRKHPESIKQDSGKRFYLSPLLSRPPFSNQSKDHWRNYTNFSTRCWWPQRKKNSREVFYPYQAERIRTQNNFPLLFRLAPSLKFFSHLMYLTTLLERSFINPFNRRFQVPKLRTFN